VPAKPYCAPDILQVCRNLAQRWQIAGQ